MNFLIPIALFGWIPFSIYLFYVLKPHRAVLFSIIGGWLFLPTIGFDLPGLPEYTKSTAIAAGVILGGRISGHRSTHNMRFSVYDLPMVFWCASPFISSITNDLGVYDGLSTAFDQVMIWGVPYFSARIYFNSAEKLHDLLIAVVLGGLIYLPLCLFEIRMSPRLNLSIYGFFPHDWIQHKRYGGWRPIVFMQHGLMVALWMASAAIGAFWIWRSKYIESIKGLPMFVIVVGLVVTTLLCKSANGWFALVIGCCCYFIYNKSNSRIPFFLLMISVPVYVYLRISGSITGQDVEVIAGRFFDAERVHSLGIRLLQEDLFVEKALERPIFGWGGYSRGWPVDPLTGQYQIKWVDALWLITFSKHGFFGLVSFIFALLMGPWLFFRTKFHIIKKRLCITPLIPAMLSIAVALFMIDCLVNGMINPIYTMISGAIASVMIVLTRETIKQPESQTSAKAN